MRRWPWLSASLVLLLAPSAFPQQNKATEQTSIAVLNDGLAMMNWQGAVEAGPPQVPLLFTNASCMTVNFTATDAVDVLVATGIDSLNIYIARSPLNTTIAVPGSYFTNVTSKSFTVRLEPLDVYGPFFINPNSTSRFVRANVTAYGANAPACSSDGAAAAAKFDTNTVGIVSLTDTGAAGRQSEEVYNITGASCVSSALNGPNVEDYSGQSASTVSAHILNIRSVTATFNVTFGAFLLSSASSATWRAQGQPRIPYNCTVASSQPGPCFSTLNGLDPSSNYTQWFGYGQLATAVATPITALFVYPKGQGTCDATTSLLRFLATEAPTPAPAPAPAPEPSFAPNPANSHALLPGLGPAFGPAFAPANAPVGLVTAALPPPVVAGAVGAVVGGVVGGIVGFGIIAGAAFFWLRKRRPRPQGYSRKDIRLNPTSEVSDNSKFGSFSKAASPFHVGNLNVFELTSSNSSKATSRSKGQSKETSSSRSWSHESPEAGSFALSAALGDATRFAQSQVQGIPPEWHHANGLPDELIDPSQLRPQTDKQRDIMAVLDKNWMVDIRQLKSYLDEAGNAVVLGEGGYGKVFRGRLHGTEDVAVKLALKPSHSKLERFKREIMLLKACHNPHIVQFLGASISSERTFLVMEYMPEGNLLSKLRSQEAEEFSWYQRGARIALDVAKGLVYLHSCHIVHLDIKSANVLLTQDFRAKIADVGLGKPVNAAQTVTASEDQHTIDSAIGTLGWAAPEQLLGKKTTCAADIYSMGVLMWEICTMDIPRVGHYREVNAPSEAPQEIKDLINRCCELDPRLRPTAAELHAAIQRCMRLSHSG